MEQPGHEPAPIWNTGDKSRGFIYYATMLALIFPVFYFYLFEGQSNRWEGAGREREIEIEIKIFYPLVLSPNASNNFSLAEAGSVKLHLDLLGGWHGPKCLSHCMLPPRVFIGRKLGQKQCSQESN